MRRKIGLFKEYDIVEFTADDPDGQYFAGESGVIVSMNGARPWSRAEFTIERNESDVLDGEDFLRCIVVTAGTHPPLRIIDTFFGTKKVEGDTFDSLPDDRRFINIELQPEITENP